MLTPMIARKPSLGSPLPPIRKSSLLMRDAGQCGEESEQSMD
jgi:hypothetical protein